MMQITHAGSQWRKLCARYQLDPDIVTARDVEREIGQVVLEPIIAANDQITNALEDTQEWREWDHLSGGLQEALGNMSCAINAAVQPGA